MKSGDFRGELRPDGRIVVPPEIASQVPHREPVQVLLQWGASEEDAAWRVRAAGSSSPHLMIRSANS